MLEVLSRLSFFLAILSNESGYVICKIYGGTYLIRERNKYTSKPRNRCVYEGCVLEVTLFSASYVESKLNNLRIM